MTIRRGDIFMADLSITEGSEQGGFRPVLVIQNDKGNTHTPTINQGFSAYLDIAEYNKWNKRD